MTEKKIKKEKKLFRLSNRHQMDKEIKFNWVNYGLYDRGLTTTPKRHRRNNFSASHYGSCCCCFRAHSIVMQVSLLFGVQWSNNAQKCKFHVVELLAQFSAYPKKLCQFLLDVGWMQQTLQINWGFFSIAAPNTPTQMLAFRFFIFFFVCVWSKFKN